MNSFYLDILTTADIIRECYYNQTPQSSQTSPRQHKNNSNTEC